LEADLQLGLRKNEYIHKGGDCQSFGLGIFFGNCFRYISFYKMKKVASNSKNATEACREKIQQKHDGYHTKEDL